jgi:predicted nucleic acid-binding protein
MRRYLLDTTPLSAYLLGRDAAVQLISPWMQRDEVVTSILVYGEVLESLKNMGDFPRRRAHFHLLLRAIYPATLTYPIMQRYADLRRAMRPPFGSGLIGDVDTLIAATALERGLTVVTADRGFQRIPDLNVMLTSPRF